MDIKEKYNAFIERVNRESTREQIPWFGKQVELEARKALDSESPPGMLVIDFVADRPGDFGDEMFNVMYGTEVELRCAVNKDNARTMRYKHAPREIDGVLYLAAVNPLVVHWEVNIGEMRPINPNAEPILTGKIKKEKQKCQKKTKRRNTAPPFGMRWFTSDRRRRIHPRASSSAFPIRMRMGTQRMSTTTSHTG